MATQHETTFTQWLDLGTFTYSVVAVDHNGQQSLPAFATVEITVLGVDSIENTVKVFPNPTCNWLNISYDQPFHFVIFNDLGQKVKEGDGSGYTPIDCGMLSRGVYILHLTAEGKVFIKKISIQ